MRPEEALDVLKRMRVALATARVDGIRVLEPLNIAIAATEKQIPKKPERLNAFKAIGKCGGCERVISTRTASVYCQYCGNKVDWRNEE